MGLTYAILTGAVITPQDFIAFLSQAGAYATGRGFEGQMDKDDATIWVGIDNTIYSSIKEAQENSDDWQAILQKLGAEPQTSIVIETLGNTSTDSDLVIEFACAFCERWPCVVDNLYDRVYSADELQALRQSGGSLS
jgi:hypothetical protein